MTDNPFEDFVVEYFDDPVRFVQEVLGAEPLPYQADFLNAIAGNERKISVRSGHGTGKSTSASWAMLWYLMLRFPNKVVVTAPTSGQLFDALFAELKRWIGELPDQLQNMLIVKSDRVELAAAPSEAFISARTSRAETPEALAGVHSDNVLLVVDEASGVPEKVFEAAAGSMSGHNATTILLSNPTRSSGTFYESQNRMADSWWTRRWSCVESPLVSDEFVDEMRMRYGEESNAFRIRVLGEFPLADDDTIIPFHLADAAMSRDIEVDEDRLPVWSVDPARFGSDRTAFCKRTGSVVTETFVSEEKILPDTNPDKQYDFATSFLKNGDYNMAERAFREFVNTNPDHKLAGNAQYWYAETFRIRQLFTDAASAYLEGYQKYPKSEKAPINLLKLGVSLVQIGEKDQGCLMITGVKQQYPEANQSVLQKAKYEEKKFECSKDKS